MPEVISKKDENAVTSLLNVLKEKWEHILPLPAAFESELFRWSNHWKRQEAMPDESVPSITASHADGIFFSNIRELLKILAVLPIGSTEAERSFSADSTTGWDRQWPRTDSLICPSSPRMVTLWLLWRPTEFAEHLWNSIQEGWRNHHFLGSKRTWVGNVFIMAHFLGMYTR